MYSKKSPRTTKYRKRRKKNPNKNLQRKYEIVENDVPEIDIIDDENFVHNLKVPEYIKTPAHFGNTSTYNKNIAQQIIIDVASTNKPVDKIAEEYGVAERKLYVWMSISEPLKQVWLRALECRTIVSASSMENDISQLETVCNDRNEDPRYQHALSGSFDRKWRHREWFMAKLNRKLFGDSKDIGVNITVNTVELRQAAWDKHRVQEAEYTEANE